MDSSNEQKNTNQDVQENINELGLLLQKKRNPDKAERVNDVLKSNLSVIEKISRIKEIDTSGHYAGPEQYKDAIEDYRDLLKRENIIDSGEAKRFREIIKAPATKSTIFNYIFKDFRKIKEFSIRYDVITCYLLPPKIKIIKPNLIHYFSRLQKDSMELVNFMKQILKEGWRYLSKKEYNMIFYFSELCKKIVSTNFNLLDFKDENLIDKLRSLENLFLTCNYKDHYPEVIRSCISTVIDKNPDWKISQDIMDNLISSVLQQRETNPSLYSIITGLNIVKYRKFFKFHDLILSGTFRIISNFDYECDENVRKKIRAQIDENLKNLIEHIRQKEEIDKLKKYLQYQADRIDISKLSHFYEAQNEKKGFKFLSDKENVLEFVQRFFDAFLVVFEDFLVDTVRIDSLSEVKIFANDYFQYEVDRIKYLIKKIQKYNYSSPNFPLARYMELKVAKKGGTLTESEILQIISDFIQTLQVLANKLIEVDRYHNDTFDEENKNEPLNLTAVMKRKFSIPYFNRKIVMPTILNDFSVKNSIGYIISISFLFNIFLHDTNIPNLIDKENGINNSIKNEKEIIERLTTIIELRKIKEKYNFL